MAKEKTILEKFTDTVKDIASTATEAANYALKVDESGLKAQERAVAYMPLAADGLVSDPLMVPPVAVVKKKRAKKSTTAKKRVTKAAEKSAKKSTKAVKKSSARKS